MAAPPQSAEASADAAEAAAALSAAHAEISALRAAAAAAATAAAPAAPATGDDDAPAPAAEVVPAAPAGLPVEEAKKLTDHNAYLQSQVAAQQAELDRRSSEEDKYGFLKNQNLDYLKNLVLQIVCEKRPGVRERMLPVLDDILELTESERQLLVAEFPTIKFPKKAKK